MGDARPDVRVYVVGDDEHAERRTRSLGEALEAVEGLVVSYAFDGAGPADPRAKGPGAVELLHIGLDWAWPVAAPLLAEKIRSWSKEARNETVRVHVGEEYLEVRGDPTPEQLLLLMELLGKHGE